MDGGERGYMNGTTDLPRRATKPMIFPIGYHSLHPDVSMNFQMNRWFGSVGEPDMLEEMRIAAARIATYADWKREFVTVATGRTFVTTWRNA